MPEPTLIPADYRIDVDRFNRSPTHKYYFITNSDDTFTVWDFLLGRTRELCETDHIENATLIVDALRTCEDVDSYWSPR